MNKTIFITGSTDGIGLATAKMLTLLGHHVLIAMWSSGMAASLKGDKPTIFAVNPGSMLGTKMVKTRIASPAETSVSVQRCSLVPH